MHEASLAQGGWDSAELTKQGTQRQRLISSHWEVVFIISHGRKTTNVLHAVLPSGAPEAQASRGEGWKSLDLYLAPCRTPCGALIVAVLMAWASMGAGRWGSSDSLLS